MPKGVQKVAFQLEGQKFNRLKVIKRVENSNDNKSQWLCKCDCGNKTIVEGRRLVSGKTKSCNCLQKETISKFASSHCMSKTRVYKIWFDIKRRCNDKNNHAYEYYGGRGIKICKRWLNFENFYEDMGDPPKGYCIERVDNDKGYNKKNCVWGTRKDQSRNRRDTLKVIIKGKEIAGVIACEKYGLRHETVKATVYKRKNITYSQAFIEVLRRKNPKSKVLPYITEELL